MSDGGSSMRDFRSSLYGLGACFALGIGVLVLNGCAGGGQGSLAPHGPSLPVFTGVPKVSQYTVDPSIVVLNSRRSPGRPISTAHTVRASAVGQRGAVGGGAVSYGNGPQLKSSNVVTILLGKSAASY